MVWGWVQKLMWGWIQKTENKENKQKPEKHAERKLRCSHKTPHGTRETTLKAKKGKWNAKLSTQKSSLDWSLPVFFKLRRDEKWPKMLWNLKKLTPQTHTHPPRPRSLLHRGSLHTEFLHIWLPLISRNPLTKKFFFRPRKIDIFDLVLGVSPFDVLTVLVSSIYKVLTYIKKRYEHKEEI